MHFTPDCVARFTPGAEPPFIVIPLLLLVFVFGTKLPPFLSKAVFLNVEILFSSKPFFRPSRSFLLRPCEVFLHGSSPTCKDLLAF